GYGEAAAEPLAELVARKPQHYQHRAQLAAALAMADRRHEAIDVLAEAQRILAAAGERSADFDFRMAEQYAALGDTAAADSLIAGHLSSERLNDDDALRLVRVLAALGRADEALRRLADVPEPGAAWAGATWHRTRGRALEAAGQSDAARAAYGEAVAADPYDAWARLDLIALLVQAGDDEAARAAVAEADALALSLGPDFSRIANSSLTPNPGFR
ncbi:MAG: tetratricopeptide repeat protein, partial [Longimicrobiales bacterium]